MGQGTTTYAHSSGAGDGAGSGRGRASRRRREGIGLGHSGSWVQPGRRAARRGSREPCDKGFVRRSAPLMTLCFFAPPTPCCLVVIYFIFPSPGDPVGMPGCLEERSKPRHRPRRNRASLSPRPAPLLPAAAVACREAKALITYFVHPDRCVGTVRARTRSRRRTHVTAKAPLPLWRRT
ncbi:hypothetical protein GQ53DRAFT_99628 [Thozetella sp. PMI_491]|nr:hypothetical protein GQ53DRAFT_99628 [Thozetella sp. PMI_491]